MRLRSAELTEEHFAKQGRNLIEWVSGSSGLISSRLSCRAAMIALERSAKPAVLAENEIQWAEEFAADPTSKRYKTGGIKEALRQISADKCAYCESAVTPTYVGDVEHILPKSKVPQLVVAWENLAFVCWLCNNAKKDYFDENAPLIDPYKEDPEGHLTFAGPIVLDLTNKGRDSVAVLELDRDALNSNRLGKMKEVHRLLRLWHETPPGPGRYFLLVDLRRETQKESEYAGVARSLLAHLAKKGGTPSLVDLGLL